MSHVEIARTSTRGSFALFAGNFLTTVISFLAVIIIARLLGPSLYGEYTLSILIPSLLLNLLGFGVNSGITRYAAYHLSQDRPDLAKRMTINGIAFILVFGVVLTAISYVSGGFLSSVVLNRPEITSLVQFASLIIIAQAIFQSGVSALLGWSSMGKISFTNILQALLRFAVAVPLVVLGFAVFGALVGYVVSVTLGGVFALVLLFPRMGGVSVKPFQHFSEDVSTMLSYGRTLFVGQFAVSISAEYVLIVLASIVSNGFVGFYQSANNFVTVITITSGAIAQALFPAFAHLEGTKGDLSRAFTLASKYMAFALAPLIFLMMGASIQIIRVPLPSYGVASGYLALLAFSNISLLLGHGVLPSFFNGVGRPRFYTLFSLAGAGVLVVLAPLLSIVLGLGVPGLIFSVLISNMIAVTCGLYLSSKHFGARIDFGAALSILASSIVAFLAILPLEMSHFNDLVLLVLEIVVFATVYLTVAPLFRALGPGDIGVLESALTGLGKYKPFIMPILDYERFIMRYVGRRQ